MFGKNNLLLDTNRLKLLRQLFNLVVDNNSILLEMAEWWSKLKLANIEPASMNSSGVVEVEGFT